MVAKFLATLVQCSLLMNLLQKPVHSGRSNEIYRTRHFYESCEETIKHARYAALYLRMMKLESTILYPSVKVGLPKKAICVFSVTNATAEKRQTSKFKSKRKVQHLENKKVAYSSVALTPVTFSYDLLIIGNKG